ncbi:MAG: hypothetical protein HOO96_45140 [Polyangiaceae bacterium]|nr:hypothetical protein [Polyangiaceae bacterium]
MRFRIPLVGALVTAACNVAEPEAAPNGAAPGRCDAVAMVRSDYVSSVVSLASVSGTLVSPRLFSSGSARPGTGAALSGDVVLPHDAPASGALVVLDRFPAGVITWLDPGTGTVRGQLNVSTGFPANPHDYLELADTKAYVTRFETNAAPGAQPLDGGGDLLIVDPQAHRVTGRIDLSAFRDTSVVPPLEPRPDRMLRRGSQAIVTLGNMDRSFKRGGPGIVVGIDGGKDAVAWSARIAGYTNCGGVALSPDGKRLAVACSGIFAAGSAAQRAESGVVLLEVGDAGATEVRRFAIADALDGATPSQSLVFSGASTLLGVAFGDIPAGRSDVLFRVDLESGAVRSLTRPAGGGAFVYGDLSCPCGGPCLLADAEAFQLLAIEQDRVSPRLVLPRDVPPRALGGLR